MDSGWIQDQWNDIKGNLKFWLILLFGGTLVKVLTNGLQWWQQAGLILVFLSSCTATFILARKSSKKASKEFISPVVLKLKRDFEHAGDTSTYRLAVKNTGPQISNVKLWIVDPKPTWMDEENYAKYNLHFPFRLWRPQIGSEPDGCSINAGATEIFHLLRWWVDSIKRIQVELGGDRYATPQEPWALHLRVEWSEGHHDSTIRFISAPNALEVALDQGELLN